MIEPLRKLFYEMGWNPLVGAALVLAAAYVLAKVVDFLVARVLRRCARETPGCTDDDFVEAIQGPLVKSVVLVGLWVATVLLDLDRDSTPEAPTHYTAYTANALKTIGIFLWVVAGLRVSTILLRAATTVESRFVAIEERTFPLFANLSKVLLVGAALYGIIVVWKLDATGWLASAGIVGLALGLAAQDSLANLFAGVFIIADAPYKIGDFINLESGERGQVIHIGLRSTRLRTRDDIEITIPNSVMGKARITNETAGESSKRRLRVSVGVAYGSDVAQVKQALMDAAAAEPLACAHPEPRVRFRAFGDSALDFELLCWIPEPVLRGRALDALNTAVYETFRERGIEIPFPQRDVYVRALPENVARSANG